MCTLIAVHRRIPGVWLAVAANRDEFRARGSEGPAIRDLPGGTALAPSDRVAGGTWLGLGGTGVFAAVTNRRCANPDPRNRSRGLLVHDMLAARSARDAAEMLRTLPEGTYNPFNAFVADAERAFALVYEGAPELTELEPGAHAICNADPDDRGHPKVARALEAAERASSVAREQLLPELAGALGTHGPDRGIEGLCVHGSEYGTRSSALFALADAPTESRFLWADGPPCSTGFEDFTPLLNELSRTAGYGSGETLARKAS